MKLFKLFNSFLINLKMAKLMAVESVYSDHPANEVPTADQTTDDIRKQFGIDTTGDNYAGDGSGDDDNKGAGDTKKPDTTKKPDDSSNSKPNDAPANEYSVEVQSADETGGDEPLYNFGDNSYKKDELEIMLKYGMKNSTFKVGDKTLNANEFFTFITTPVTNDDANKDDNNAQDEKTFRIGKDDFTYSQLIEKASTHYGAFVKDLPEDQKSKILTSFIDTLNKGEFNKKATQTHQKQADRTRELDERENAVKEKEEKINNDLDSLEAREKELQAIIDADTSDMDDDDRIAHRVKKEFAEDEIKSVKNLHEKFTTDLNNIHFQGQIDSLISEFPVLKTKRHIYDILEDYEQSGKIDPEEKEDLKRARIVQDALKAYDKKFGLKGTVRIADFFEVENFTKRLEELTGSKASKERKKSTGEIIDLTGLTMEQRIKALQSAQSDNPSSPNSANTSNSAANSGGKTQIERPTLKGIGFD